MTRRHTRNGILMIIAALWLAGLTGIASARRAEEPGVTVVHWANSHMTRHGLLREMADQFNSAGRRTGSGQRIAVQAFNYGSGEQVDDLVSRASRGVSLDRKLPDPVIVTPSADHWLVRVNETVGHQVIDLGSTRSIAHTSIGIVTYRDMAECLGWPSRDIGYADIIALRDDPRGWGAYPCARAEWGQRPLLSFTDPNTSSTGRSALYTLYSIAAGKPADQLTLQDVRNPRVVGYVRSFQRVVDHYMNGTIPLNTKVHLGPHFGHFFLMPEDDLVHLYLGGERAVINGTQVEAPPITRPMVMIYPKEGSTAHNHSGTIVQASWVSAEQVEAAQMWLGFLYEDAQQRAFMAAGFRPSTGLPVADPISGRFGIDPAKPTATINPDRIDRSAARAILDGWDDVKQPGIVTFVADVSGSMQGTKLEQAKRGLLHALDDMSRTNLVGLVTFANGIKSRVDVAPLTTNRFRIAGAVQAMQAGGETALYDAVRAGIEMADAAPGDDDAIRGVVVVTDGIANSGSTDLDDLVRMTSRNERPITRFRGFSGPRQPIGEGGTVLAERDVMGAGLALETRHRILIFFVGIGKDADMEIGRILAEASGATFEGAAEKDLARVLQAFGRYF
jgi:Ca-activated chloride channel homolog